MPHLRTGLVAAASSVALLLPGAGTAFAEVQPADLGNVQNADRGASAFGPHCHHVLPAQGRGRFANVITGAAHQAHTQTGLPTGIFQATPCP